MYIKRLIVGHITVEAEANRSITNYWNIMFLKITVIAIVAIVATVATSDGDQVWDGYSAKWAANVTDGFYQLPTTLYAAWSQGWTRMSGTVAPDRYMAVAYRGDPRLVLLFSTSDGRIAGHQVGVPVAEINRSRVPNFWYSANSGFTQRTLNGEAYFTATALYKQDATGGNRQIWLERNGEFEQIPTRSDLLITDSPYYAKRCVNRMGQHFYAINSTSMPADRYPWFLLVIREEVVGIGFQSIGRVSSAPARTWFETIDNVQLRITIPDLPQSSVDAIVSNGIISLHLWFRRDPVAIQCIDRCTAVYNATIEASDYFSTRRKRALGPGNVC